MKYGRCLNEYCPEREQFVVVKWLMEENDHYLYLTTTEDHNNTLVVDHIIRLEKNKEKEHF